MNKSKNLAAALAAELILGDDYDRSSKIQIDGLCVNAIEGADIFVVKYMVSVSVSDIDEG